MSMIKKIARSLRTTLRTALSSTAAPGSVRYWLRLIDDAVKKNLLSPHHLQLVKSHEISMGGHAVNVFAGEIEKRCSSRLESFAKDSSSNLGNAVEELVRWKTAIQCGHSHDVSKGYFIDAEQGIEWQWNQIIYPIIRPLNFDVVLDLACGHGRNSEYLRKLTKQLHLIDINQSCLDACRERFGDEIDGTKIFYHLTDGNNLRAIDDDAITLVYTWDSMVHFDKLVVEDYVREIARVLKPGGSAFLHHSNLGAISPDSDWAHNAGTRSDMSADLMKQYASACGLDVVEQHIQGTKEGWGQDALDCVSVLRKPQKAN